MGLKVMRLSKPSFRPLATVVCEPWDLAASTLPQPDPSTATHRGASPYDNAFCLSEQLMLPTSFGSIYVGEEFVSYISIFNSSNAPITALSIKAELQTTSNKRYCDARESERERASWRTRESLNSLVRGGDARPDGRFSSSIPSRERGSDRATATTSWCARR